MLFYAERPRVTGGNRRTVLGLAGGAVAQLRVERLLAAQLVLDLPAMAAGLVTSLEAVVGLVDPVRGSLLPLGLALGGLVLCLVAVHLFSLKLGVEVTAGCEELGGGGDGGGGDGGGGWLKEA